MRKVLISTYKVLGVFGFNPQVFIYFFRGFPSFLGDLKRLKKQRGDNKDFPFGATTPILENRFQTSGTMSGHYFHQDLFIAKKVFINKPVRHVDIGSRTDGFVAQVAVFREIEVIDIRPQTSKVANIIFKQMDLMGSEIKEENYCDSLSSLHAIEHFGLGRYGDPIDYFGHLKAFNNIHKILKPGGKFYFSTPIGPQRIEFNAHRVFSVQYLLDQFKDKYVVQSFSYVDEKGDLIENATLSQENINANFNCNFGCGIFELIKK